jgi:putative addiction module killer protein
MLQEKRTLVYEKWVTNLPSNVRAVIINYVNRVKNGYFSNCKALRYGINEIKINFQKGYRIYYTMSGNKTIIVLLSGGIKSGQGKEQSIDIMKAKRIREELKKKGEI